MKKNKDLARIMMSGLTVVGLISIIIRVIALFTAFDTEIGYFSSTSIVTYLNRAFALVTIIFGCAVILPMNAELLPAPNCGSGLKRTFTSLMLSFAFGIGGILFIVSALAAPSTVLYIIIIGALVSAVYYLYDAVKPFKGGSPYRVIAAAVSAASLLLIILLENFDMTTTLNSPEKIGVVFFVICAALYTIEDSRALTSAASPKLYIFSLYLTAFLGAYISVPGIIANICGILNDPMYLIYYLIAFAFAIRAVAYIYTYSRETEIAENEESEVENVDIT